MRNTLSFPAASLRDPAKSETTKLRDDFAWDCDEISCTGHEAEILTPHRHLIASGENPPAGPRFYKVEDSP
jgi:hypothetical protein